MHKIMTKKKLKIRDRSICFIKKKKKRNIFPFSFCSYMAYNTFFFHVGATKLKQAGRALTKFIIKVKTEK